MAAYLLRARANARQRVRRWLKIPINKLRLRLALIASTGVIVSIGIIVLVIHRTKPGVEKRVTAVEMESTVATTVGNAPTIDPQIPDTSAKWIKSIDVDDNDVVVNGKVIETIDENQVFTGGIDVPLGWTVEYSTDPRTTPQQSLTFQSYNVANQQANPLSDITFLRFDTAATGTVKPSVSTPLTKPLDPYRFITDGQKFSTPIVFDHKIYLFAESVRIATAGTYHLDCFDLVTYARCLGKSGENLFPTYFSASGASATTTTPLGTGTRTINTAETLQLVMDDGTYGHRGRVYMPAQVGNNYGVNCMDLELYANCGFTSLGSAAAPPAIARARIWGSQGLHDVPANPSWLSGFVQSGSKIYGHADDRDVARQTVVCFDIRDPASGGGACSGYTAATTAITKTMRTGDYDHYANTTYQMIVGERLFWTVNYRHSNKAFYNPAINEGWPYSDTDYWLGTVTTCFNVTTRLPCPNYDYNVRVNDSIENNNGTFDALGLNIRGIASNTAMFPKFVDGNLAAVCYLVSGTELTGSGPVDTATRCINPDTGQNTPGAQSPQIVPTGMVWPSNLDSWAGYIWRANKNPLTITDATDGHQKTYVTYNIMQPNLVRSAMSCYDWTTSAVCANWPQMKYMYNVNGGVNTEMSLAYDGSCLIAFSAQGFVRSINPTTSESSCRVARARFTAKINLNDYYCDGVQRAFSWRSARLAQGNPYDFQRLNIDVYDQKDGTLIKSGDIKNNSALDMSDIDPGPTESLFLDINSSVYNTSPWAQNRRPYVATQADGDNVQYCYTTRAKTYAENIACDVSQLKTLSSLNLLSGSDTFVRNNVTAINYLQPSDKQCFKDLAVSITPNKNNVKNGESFEYKVNIQNKANPDSAGRGNIPSDSNSRLANFKISIPEGVTFVSASNGGIQSGDEIIWQDQSIEAGQTSEYTVVLESPASGASSNSRAFFVLALADYEDDTAQDDNTVSNNDVYFTDNAQPVVSDFQQSWNTLRAPSNLTFSVRAVDDSAISAVQLFRDGLVVGEMQPTGQNDEYTIVLNNVAAGTYQFSARVSDDATPSASATTEAVEITVTPENAAPTVVSFDRTGASNAPLKAPASLTYQARVDDDYTLPVVEFLENGVVKAQLTKSGSPSENRYNHSLSGLSVGTYTFLIRATDSENPDLVSYSQPVTVNVLPANTAPVISSIGQTSQSLVAPATITMTANVTDDYGLSKVELLNGGSVLGRMQPTGVANQYSLSLTGQQAGTYSLKVRATDSDSPALVTESGVFTVQVVSPPPPPPDPPVTPTPSDPPSPSNQAPSVVGLVQKVQNPKAPAKLSFEVYADDDSGIDKVELFRGSDNIGSMQSMGSSYYAITLDDYSSGSYSFRARATDNGNPSLTAFTSDIVVEVAVAQATQGPSGGESGGQQGNNSNDQLTPAERDRQRQINHVDDTGRTVTYREGVEQRLTPLAIRNDIPQSFVGTVEGMFRVADRVVAPVSPTTARVLPYTIIIALVLLAVSYLVIATNQLRTRDKLKKTIERYEKTEERRHSYVDLTSHYLGTPLATMQGSLELLASQNQVDPKTSSSIGRYLKRMAGRAKDLLNGNDAIAETAVRTGSELSSMGKVTLMKNIAVVGPVVGVMLALIMLNFLFVWSKKYSADFTNIILQTSLYVLGAGGVLMAFSHMKHAEAASLAMAQELAFEDRAAQVQSEFIKSSGQQFAFEIGQIKELSSTISDDKYGEIFKQGLGSIDTAVNKLQYLEQLTSGVIQNSGSSLSLDISLQSVIKDFVDSAKQKGIALNIEAHTQLTGKIDEDGFRHVISSLLDNAINFTPSGGVITLRAITTKDKTEISVEDTGPGISKAKLDQLFQPFIRATDTRTFNYEGMGLDLYMTRLILDGYDGEIHVATKEGQGAKFTITLKA